MGERTGIAWCDHTFNPWWGCTKVSPGCEHCYAEAWAARVGLAWGPQAERRMMTAAWKDPLKWNRAAQREGVRHRVFCASMADWLDDRPELVEPRARLCRLVEATAWLDWLMLTKRPENAVRLASQAGWTGRWPENAWAGCTVENQKMADGRLSILAAIPADIHFVSYEPALERVDFRPWLGLDAHDESGCHPIHERDTGLHSPPDAGDAPERVEWALHRHVISLVIVGGESGPHARPFDVASARDTIRQCREAGAGAFVKQLGSRPYDLAGDSLCADSTPPVGAFLDLRDRKGGDPAEWPEDLRVREWPT